MESGYGQAPHGNTEEKERDSDSHGRKAEGKNMEGNGGEGRSKHPTMPTG